MNNETARLLGRHFDTAFAAPDGIKKLRELILTLAMQGRLVEQDPSDPPASELLKEIEVEKQRLVKDGKIKKPKPLPPIKPEDVPYQLPQGWEWVYIQDIFAVVTDGDHQAPPKAEYGVPFLVIGNLNTGKVNFEGCRYVPKDYYESLDWFRKPKKNDILYTVTGSYGIPIQVDCDDQFCVQRHVAILKSFANTPVQYIRNLLKSVYAFNYATLIATGIAQKTVPLLGLRRMLVALPPPNEQHRILARIDQLMARCDELEKLRAEREMKRLAVHAAAIRQLLDEPSSFPRTKGLSPRRRGRESRRSKELDPRLRGGDGSREAWDFIQQHFGELYTVKENVAELRKTILQLAVMGRLVPQDPNDPPASELLQEIEAEKQRLVKEGKIKKPKPLPTIKPEEAPYDIPQGWEWVRLGRVSNTRLGKMLNKAKNRGHLKPYLRNTNVQWHQFILDDVKEMKFEDGELGEFRILPGDLLICEGGEPGRCAIWGDPELEIYFQKAIHRVRPFSCVTSEYLQVCLTNDAGNDQLAKYFTGATIKHFPGDKLNGYVVPLPPLPEQHRIVAKIDQMMALCDTLEQQIAAATAKQTELLNAVMAGCRP